MLFRFTLAAGQDYKIDFAGNYFFIEEATGAVQVSADGDAVIVRRAGQGATRSEPFQTLNLKDISGSSNTIELEINLVTRWQLENSRQAPVVQGTSPWISKERPYSVPSAVVSNPGSVAASLTGVLADSREVIIWNAGTTTLFIGPSSVTTANGMPIDAGDKLVLSNCGWQVYGIRAGSAEAARALIQRD